MNTTVKALAAGILCAAMLAGCGNSAPAKTEAAAPAEITGSSESTEPSDSDGVYKVHVTNILGEPVPGVKVQFCSESECMFATTDNDGYVEFAQPEGQNYETHLLKVPKGYARDENVYQVPDKYSTVEIELQIEGGIDGAAEKARTS